LIRTTKIDGIIYVGFIFYHTVQEIMILYI